MPEMTASTREAARRLGVSDTALRKAERAGRIAREPDGQWDIEKTRRRLTETADPVRSPLASGAGADGTPFARLKVAQTALKVEAQRLALDERKGKLLHVIGAMRSWTPPQRLRRHHRLIAERPDRIGRPVIASARGKADAGQEMIGVQASSDGIRRCQSVISCQHRPSARRRSSSKCRPTNCNPTGIPESKPQGSESVGTPR
jgi:hypothetical protein